MKCNFMKYVVQHNKMGWVRICLIQLSRWLIDRSHCTHIWAWSHRTVARPQLSFDTHLREVGSLSPGAKLIRFYGVVMMRRQGGRRWDEMRGGERSPSVPAGVSKWAFYLTERNRRSSDGAAANMSTAATPKSCWPQLYFLSHFDTMVSFPKMTNRLKCESISCFFLQSHFWAPSLIFRFWIPVSRNGSENAPPPWGQIKCLANRSHSERRDKRSEKRRWMRASGVFMEGGRRKGWGGGKSCSNVGLTLLIAQSQLKEAV